MNSPYNKLDVLEVERRAIANMLAVNPDLYAYSPEFIRYASRYYPEWSAEDTKIVAVAQLCSDTPIYFWEVVGHHLWSRWNSTRSQADSDAFVTYMFPVIEGVIFRSGQHLKSKLGFDELFQELVLVILAKMGKFDPNRVVSRDKAGTPTYARVFSYFNHILFWQLITVTTAHASKNPDMDVVDADHDSDVDVMPWVTTEFHLALQDLAKTAVEAPLRRIASCLDSLVNTDAGMVSLLAHPITTLRSKAGVDMSEITAFYAEHGRLVFGYLDALRDTWTRTTAIKNPAPVEVHCA